VSSQRPIHRFLYLALSALGTAVALAVIVVLVLSKGSSAGESTTPEPATVTVENATYGRPIPAGFVGLSIEFPAIESYAGSDPSALNPVFLQLVRNLAPGQRPSLRIGGDSSDWTWWPVPGIAQPRGVRYVLDARWRAVAAALSQQLQAKVILGINLEAGSVRIAATEARALTAGIPRADVQGLEPGNEPELYGSFAWYRTAAGKKVTGRPRGYNYAAFLRDFKRFAPALTEAPLVGPAIGAPKWMSKLPAFLATAPRLGLVTLHRYPLQLCFVHPNEAKYPSIAHVLADAASRGLADSVVPYVAMVHRRGLPLRIDEMNTISCGLDNAVGETYAGALWALDAVFEMARVGVDGVNIHTYPGATYELFSFNGAQAFVFPEYYGLMMFAQAAPPGARLLRLTESRNVKSWATRAQDGRTRVVLINRSATTARIVTVRLRGAAATTATLERLTGQGLTSRTGTTLGGHGFGASTSTGILPPADNVTVSPLHGSYVVKLPPASAAILTF
jgi:hypothetical protein